MPRSPEEREYHARKAREYRNRDRDERDRALTQLGTAVSVLQQKGYSLGAIVNLVVGIYMGNDTETPS